jgi:phage tail-like protein
MVAAAIGRSFAPLTGWEQWLRCGHHGTTVDPTTEEVTLAWEAADTTPAAAGGVGRWPAEAVPAGPAGLAFDLNGCLYHGVPERGQLQRVPWPRPPSGSAEATEPVDLLPPVRGPAPRPGSFAPADPAAGASIRAVALAADADEHLFVLDGDNGEIAVVDLADGHLLRRIVLRWPAVDLAADGRAILVATADRAHPLVTVDALGAPLEVALAHRAVTALAEVPAAARPARVAVGPRGERWLLLRTATSAWAVPIADDRRSSPIQVTGATDLELTEYDGRGHLVVAGPPGRDLLVFVLRPGADAPGSPLRARNYDGRGIVRTPDGRIGFWNGTAFRVATTGRRRFVAAGHLDGFRLDSGAYQQQWGRIFVEACVPSGTSLHVGVATSDDLPGSLDPADPSILAAPPPLLGDDDATWEAPSASALELPLAPQRLDRVLARKCALHRRETGSELAWSRPDPATRLEVYEAPVQAPPGRYLWVRLMLGGSTQATPRVLAVRAEFPGHDLLERLPRTYRRDPVAASFLRRYLAMADGLLSEMELRAAQRDLLLDPYGAPVELLGWLASLIGLTLDTRWPASARRTLLAEAICLFRRRGTIAGLQRMLEIYLGCAVVIVEAFRLRGVGGAFAGGGDAPRTSADAVVGAGFRVGGDIGGTAGAARASGSTADAFRTHAHRFSVLVPRELTDQERSAVGDLLDQHRPAHTLVEVCTVGRGMRVGVGLHLAVSTLVGPTSRLRRAVVGDSRVGAGTLLGRPRAGVRPGGSRLGTDTVVDP